MDLYRVLDVKHNASAESIKSAFRKRSLQHHPDRGGSAAKFDELNKAFEVLSDPERRRRYDETGETEAASARPKMAVVANIINTFLSQIVPQLLSRGQRIEEVDLADHLKRRITESLSRLRSQHQGESKVLTAWTATRSRWTNSGPDGILEGVAGNHIAEIQRRLDAIHGEIVNLESAAEYMRNVGYRFDRPRMGGVTVTYKMTPDSFEVLKSFFERG